MLLTKVSKIYRLVFSVELLPLLLLLFFKFFAIIINVTIAIDLIPIVNIFTNV